MKNASCRPTSRCTGSRPCRATPGELCVGPMKLTEIHIEQGDALQQLMPVLEGKVFHVSKLKNLSKIRELGKILPNESGNLETSFGSSKKSLFRNKSCVSVFDYRNIHAENSQKHMYKCLPTAPLTPEEGIVGRSRYAADN